MFGTSLLTQKNPQNIIKCMASMVVSQRILKPTSLATMTSTTVLFLARKAMEGAFYGFLEQEQESSGHMSSLLRSTSFIPWPLASFCWEVVRLRYNNFGGVCHAGVGFKDGLAIRGGAFLWGSMEMEWQSPIFEGLVPRLLRLSPGHLCSLLLQRVSPPTSSTSALPMWQRNLGWQLHGPVFGENWPRVSESFFLDSGQSQTWKVSLNPGQAHPWQEATIVYYM